jgi:hypothetical protein
MIGVCIGVGPGWKEAAQLTAARMATTTGLRCVVLDKCDPPVCHPSWLKCHVTSIYPDEDSFLVFDADILPLKPWNPELLFEGLGRPFCACPDRNSPGTLRECQNFGLPWPDWYINGGMLIFGREHQRVWDYVWRKHPRYGTWLEKTALNEALLKIGIPVCRMPRTVSQMHMGSTPIARANAINLHLAGIHSSDVIIDAHRRLSDSPRSRESIKSVESIEVPA